eukprot:TRINITY_DN12284_c0_g3_i1.p1 TRINITY_DN12284_c0_g3~~TRINITY_DN12284_c0_g3_i1.p1  ORF type:complete len:705 (-),score=276.61 TRINITY_DN12284_c0_g3_i1:143-2206(-)
MKAFAVSSLLAGAAAADASESPVSKVLDLLSDLEAKVTAEGEQAKKTYVELSEWCEDTSKSLDYDIKTGKKEETELKALIEEQGALSMSLSAKLDELAGSLATDEADLKAATEIRAKEASDFAKEEKNLVETISTLQRAVGILEREMRKGGASLAQLQNAGGVAKALGALVDASMLSSADAKQLTSLVQASQDSQDEDGDEALGAPAAAVYEGHSGNIVETLENLLDKAQGQLSDARQKETNALHNFQLLEQGLKDQIKFNSKDTTEAKKSLGASSEKKATAEGDLAVTTKDVRTNAKALADLKQTCMTKSQDFEAATKSRSEELEALAAAKKAIAESTAASAKLSYGLSQVSFLQVARSQLSSSVDLVNFEAVRFVRDLAHKQHSTELSQLASRMASAMRLHSASGDPFAKVKGLIGDLIEKLESEASADASHKAYCDKELAESNAKKAELSSDADKLTTKLDQMSSRAAQLKEQVAALRKSLAQLASSQAEATKLRQEEKAAFQRNRADMQQGLEGVKLGLKILREYYAKDDKAHASADGASASIVGLLEVVESDFSKGLAEMMTTEETAAAAYEKESKEAEVERATKEADVKYKSKEATSLDKNVAELSSDRASVHAELDAVNEYLAKLEDTCVAKPDTYEQRTARREAELAGLREALNILDGEAALLQTNSLKAVHPHLQTSK